MVGLTKTPIIPTFLETTLEIIFAFEGSMYLGLFLSKTKLIPAPLLAATLADSSVFIPEIVTPSFGAKLA